MNSKAINAILMVYVGCGLNNVFLEYSIRSDPGSGHLITLSQFMFIAVHGFIFTYKFGKGRRVIPLREYLILVFLFFVTSVFNNWAFSFHIPVPLHMIFRSGSLLANMILGIVVLKKKYTFSKFLSIAMITGGIVICTLISSDKVKTCADCGDDVRTAREESIETFWWVVGIIILSTALLLSARMGIYQESLYSKFGKHPEEALYYTHMLSLPFFLLYAPDIMEHFGIATASELYRLPIIEIELPILCLFIIGNMLTQYMCISSVYVLTTECTSLTVTLVITLRKFFSLLFSIIYFQNPFTWMHWFGTALVFIGTLIFSEVLQNIAKLFVTKEFKQKTT